MTGLIVTWDGEEIQAIDEGNFEETVVEVIDNFFEAVEGYSSVTVEWAAGNGEWNHGSQYNLHRPPVWELTSNQYVFGILGQSRGGEYEIRLNPSLLIVEKVSNGQVKQLDYLTLRAPEVAINAQSEEVFVKSIPEEIRKRIVESLPTIEI